MKYFVLLLILNISKIIANDFKFIELLNLYPYGKITSMSIVKNNNVYVAGVNEMNYPRIHFIKKWDGQVWHDITKDTLSKYQNKSFTLIKAYQDTLLFAQENSPLYLFSRGKIDSINFSYYESKYRTYTNVYDFINSKKIVRASYRKHDSTFMYYDTNTNRTYEKMFTTNYEELFILENNKLTKFYSYNVENTNFRAITIYKGKVYFAFNISYDSTHKTIYNIDESQKLDSLVIPRPKYNNKNGCTFVNTLTFDNNGKMLILFALPKDYDNYDFGLNHITEIDSNKINYFFDGYLLSNSKAVTSFGIYKDELFVSRYREATYFFDIRLRINRWINPTSDLYALGTPEYTESIAIDNEDIYIRTYHYVAKYSLVANSINEETPSSKIKSLPEVLAQSQENELWISDLSGKNLMIKDVSSEESLNQILDNLKIKIALLSIKTKAGDFKFKIAR